MIGGKEVAVEAKEASLLKLNQQLVEETDADRGRRCLNRSPLWRRESVTSRGTEESEGLYALMRRAVLLAVERADTDTVSGGHIRTGGDRAKVR